MSFSTRTLLLFRRNSTPRLSFFLTSRFSSVQKPSTLNILGKSYPTDDYSNVSESILSRIGTNLHKRDGNPISLIRKRICRFFSEESSKVRFHFEDSLSPVVSTKQNFDELLIPSDHVSRAPDNTYYVNREILLRCHTSAHQIQLMRQHPAFLITGDVYRRDSIDARHYPIFHQMEGVRIFSPHELSGKTDDERKMESVADLKDTLERMVKKVIGPVESRWVEAYFPFTDPSLELEIFHNGDWVEVLGCGQVQGEIVKAAGYGPHFCGWAFGLGLERLAMILFSIPDIRLFWSSDPRFLDQFATADLNDQISQIRFRSFSKFPPCYKDISFWLPEQSSNFHENSLFDLVREIAGDLVEDVQLIDQFEHPKTRRRSLCFRINYRSMHRNLTNEEIDVLHHSLRDRFSSLFPDINLR